MSTSAEKILRLQSGFDVSQFDVFIPWFIKETELYELIPESQFQISSGGCWPLLIFSFFGFEAQFGLNFISDSEARLTEIQFYNYQHRKLKRTFRKSAKLLTKALGKPNLVDYSRGQLTWHFGALRIETCLTKHFSNLDRKGRDVHSLSISQGRWKLDR